MKILITAGHSRSLYTVALLNQLNRIKDIELYVAEVKTFKFKRFKSYLKQYGFINLYKKFSAHYMGNSKSQLYRETKPIRDFLNNNNVLDKTVKGFCLKNKISHIKVDNINGDKLYKFIQKNNLDLIIYSGGGILRKKIIESTKKGVINAHSGYLPFFRGMNVIEWALLYNKRPQTSIHFIDSGIDTGKIILRENIPFNNNLYTLRGNATVHNVNLIVKVISNIDNYTKNAISQNKEDGKQFFLMNDYLKNIVINKIKNNEEHLFKNYTF